MKINTKIFLVDDHSLVRDGLKLLIQKYPGFEICGEAEDNSQALEGIHKNNPDLVIVDLFLKKSFSGLELIKDLRLQFPTLRLIVVSMYEESLYGVRALKAGAHGYVMKKESSQKIMEAIRRVMQGGVYISDSLAGSLVSGIQNSPQGINDNFAEILSDREIEVFQYLGHGKTTIQISEIMGLSQKTIHSYCSRIKEKLNLSNYNELLRESVKCVERNK